MPLLLLLGRLVGWLVGRCHHNCFLRLHARASELLQETLTFHRALCGVLNQAYICTYTYVSNNIIVANVRRARERLDFHITVAHKVVNSSDYFQYILSFAFVTLASDIQRDWHESVERQAHISLECVMGFFFKSSIYDLLFSEYLLNVTLCLQTDRCVHRFIISIISIIIIILRHSICKYVITRDGRLLIELSGEVAEWGRLIGFRYRACWHGSLSLWPLTLRPREAALGLRMRKYICVSFICETGTGTGTGWVW